MRLWLQGFGRNPICKACSYILMILAPWSRLCIYCPHHRSQLFFWISLNVHVMHTNTHIEKVFDQLLVKGMVDLCWYNIWGAFIPGQRNYLSCCVNSDWLQSLCLFLRNICLPKPVHLIKCCIIQGISLETIISSHFALIHRQCPLKLKSVPHTLHPSLLHSFSLAFF